MDPDRPLTVAQLLPSLESGGVERGTLEVARYLVDHGHRSLVISGGGRLVAPLEAGGSRHHRWSLGHKSPLTLLRAIRLRAWLRQAAPDILHVRSRMPAWVAWLAWRGMDPRRRPCLVTTVHGLYSVNFYSAIMTRGERVIAVSETVRRYLTGNYPGIDPEKIHVIPRGVDPAEFPRGFEPGADWLADWRQAFPRIEDNRILTLPGRITRLKGHHDFIELVRRLRARGLPVHGVIAGREDPRRKRYAAELRQQVGELGLEKQITFAGNRPDLREVLAISSLVLSLSAKPESFGRTVLEALSLGRPPLGYAHGGVGETLAALYPGGAIDPGNVDALEERAAAMLEQAPSPPPLPEGFRLEAMLKATLALYQSLAGERSRNSSS